MSEIAALQIGLSALLAQKRALDVTGHNIANAGTDGYSRQRVDMVANSGPVEPALFARWNESGLGVTVDGVARAHDAFLTARANLEQAAQSSTSRTDGVLVRIEQLFAEPGDNGIQKLLSDFWNAWQDVSDHPGDSASRAQLLERASALTGAFSAAAQALESLTASTVEQLGAVVDQANTTAAAIARLNQGIQAAAAAGIDHEDLLDQRDALVKQLAGLLGVTTRSGTGDTLDVFVGGRALVRGDAAERLQVAVVPGGVQIQWAADDAPASAVGGEVGGLTEAIDSLLPRYSSALDDIARQLRDAVNAAHAARSGSIPVSAQDQSAAGALSFGVSLAGNPVATVTVAGADWSGAGGAAALQAALQSALDSATGAPGAVVATVTGGNGTPLAVGIAPANPADSLTVARVTGNAGLATLLSDVLVGTDGVGGRAFFSGTGAGDLAVALASPDAVAVATASGGPLDGAGGQRIAALGDGPSSPDAIYRSFIVGLGVEKLTSEMRLANQTATATLVEQARSAQTGVNLDEEMTNMIMYQHAYTAAARFVTAVDEMLATLIERTGLVGR
jgi:flagellar hook-associated protein FlgK